ncbi:hypothetical protein [Tahibacter caeni]|uniref:hypothetical protein n=1 Tax=Tahibacter caeni TaxID=1453545 RepID=UPI0021496D8D|nr:hypothetical protein [Tahibacter caeni]
MTAVAVVRARTTQAAPKPTKQETVLSPQAHLRSGGKGFRRDVPHYSDTRLRGPVIPRPAMKENVMRTPKNFTVSFRAN